MWQSDELFFHKFSILGLGTTYDSVLIMSRGMTTPPPTRVFLGLWSARRLRLPEPGENLFQKSPSSLKQRVSREAFFIRKYILGNFCRVYRTQCCDRSRKPKNKAEVSAVLTLKRLRQNMHVSASAGKRAFLVGWGLQNAGKWL